MRVAEMAEFLNATDPERMMSDTVKCEACNKEGKRLRGYPCPEGWFYMESFIEGSYPPDHLITYACSEECKKSPWRAGPGPKFQLFPSLLIGDSRERPYESLPDVESIKQKWCKCCACWGVWKCTPLNDFHTRPTYGKLLFCLTCTIAKNPPRR